MSMCVLRLGEGEGEGGNSDHATGDCLLGVSDIPVHTHACAYARLTHTHNHAQAGFAFLTQTREERFFVNIRKRLDNAVAIDTERCGVGCAFAGGGA